MPVKTEQPAGTASWYDLTTGKPEETKVFYQRLFGWTFEDQGPQFGHYHMVRQNGHAVAGFMPKTPEMAGMPSVWTVYFSSPDAQADALRINALGGQIISEPMQVGPLGYMLVAADPTGAAFGLWQPLAFQGFELENEHGSSTWQEVLTRDAEQAKGFYTELLLLQSQPLPGEMTYHMLQKGNANVAGVMQMDAAHWPASVPPHWMPYFSVSDIQQAIQVAAESGGQVTVTPFETPYGPVAILSDPDGAAFSVVQNAQQYQAAEARA